MHHFRQNSCQVINQLAVWHYATNCFTSIVAVHLKFSETMTILTDLGSISLLYTILGKPSSILKGLLRDKKRVERYNLFTLFSDDPDDYNLPVMRNIVI